VSDPDAQSPVQLVFLHFAGRFRWTPTLWYRSRRCTAAGIGEGAPQQELDLGVGTPQLVGGPPCQGIVDGRVEAEKDALSLTCLRRIGHFDYW
jgi:hypothetical protein